MKNFCLMLLALLPFSAIAATPAVPSLNNTKCFHTVIDVLKSEYNKFKIIDDGGYPHKIGTELVDYTDFTKLPTRAYIGMGSEFFFGLVGYVRISYHGDATSHLYNYTLVATCGYDADSKQYVLKDVNLDGKLDKKDISLQDMDFERQ